MREKDDALRVVMQFGGDILSSEGMQKEKDFLQHGTVSVYEHSLKVAVMCVTIADRLALRVDMRSLVRGALLHDYFLYDWHVSDKNRPLHAFYHPKSAIRNAERDFGLNNIERNMIGAHMFPLASSFPRYRESMILCLADKICATRETFAGRPPKIHNKKQRAEITLSETPHP